MVSKEGIVRSIRFGNIKEFIITDGERDYSYKGTIYLNHGSAISFEVGENNEILREPHALNESEGQKVFDNIKHKIYAAFSLPHSPILISDETTLRIFPKTSEVAKILLCSKKLGRSTLLRFHADADGICSAFAINSILKTKAFQQNSAIYSVKDALRDIAAIGQENRPLAVFVDFGCALESSDGIELLLSSGIEIVIIDHHPPALLQAKDPHHNCTILNPQPHSPSKYTAGYLCAEIATISSTISKEDATELASISCCGDKSDLFPFTQKEEKKALVLDFLASESNFGNNLDFYKNVLSKKDLFESIYSQSEESIFEVASKVLKTAKNHGDSKKEVWVFSLERFIKKGEWPPSSKVTTRIFDEFNAKTSKPLICIGYNDKTLILRLNQKAEEIGLGAETLAIKMKELMPDFVESGGGHKRAGAIRVGTDFVKDVLNQLIEFVQKF